MALLKLPPHARSPVTVIAPCGVAGNAACLLQAGGVAHLPICAGTAAAQQGISAPPLAVSL